MLAIGPFGDRRSSIPNSFDYKIGLFGQNLGDSTDESVKRVTPFLNIDEKSYIFHEDRSYYHFFIDIKNHCAQITVFKTVA